ncbi:ATP synthase F1 subunit epsilon [Bdellovibrionota bacterium FG-2]
MTTPLKLTVLSPERRLLSAIAIQELTLTGSEGELQILDGHAPMVGNLETGVFRYHLENGEISFGAISSGFFHVSDNHVTVMAETLELRGEIDLDRAKKAQKLAEDTLRDAALDEHRFRKYQLKLQRALVRQQVGSSGGDKT